MQSDLNVKSRHLKDSQNTAKGLETRKRHLSLSTSPLALILLWLERDQLKNDLLKISQLEAKITTEMQQLKEKMVQMKSELSLYSGKT